tara:strand:+ start:366 stop:1022 length:657 start_codon:yes stop_codon:yes gene_type:complete
VTTAIVIPAFNEEADIGRVIGSLNGCGDVIVVSDGSTDATVEIAQDAGATVIQHKANRGYDAALATGFDHAEKMNADVIVAFDADGQLDVAALQEAVDIVKRGEADIVLGQRSEKARISEVLFGLYTRIRFGVPDILCGLKAVSTSVYRQHRAAMGGASIFTGMALAALRGGASFKFVDVAVAPRVDASRIGSGWRANKEILQAMCNAIACDLKGSGR